MTPWPDWQARADELMRDFNESRWMPFRDRLAHALNEAWSEGRKFQEEAQKPSQGHSAQFKAAEEVREYAAEWVEVPIDIP